MTNASHEIWISIAACTDVGRRRTGNEDNLQVADLTGGRTGFAHDRNQVVPEVARHVVGPRGTLLIVSDGMGGAAAGEVASAMAVSIVSEEMSRQVNAGMGPVDALRTASNAANNNIWEKSQADSAVRGLGATLTAAYLSGTDLFLSQVGDSRAYLVRNGQIRQLTEDQSWANAVKKAGIEVAHVPSNVILQALGTQAVVNAEITSERLQAGDMLLLCSDGLSNKVTDEDLLHVLTSAASLEAACHELIRIANERGGEDNITVVIARLEHGGGGMAVSGDRATQHLGTSTPGGMTVSGAPPKATMPLSAMETSPNVPKISSTAPLGGSTAPPAVHPPAPVPAPPPPPAPPAAAAPPPPPSPGPTVAAPRHSAPAPAPVPAARKSGSSGKIIVILAVILLIPIFVLALGSMYYVLQMRKAASNPITGTTPPKTDPNSTATPNPGGDESIPDTMTKVETVEKEVESMRKSLETVPGVDEPKKKCREMGEELVKLKKSLEHHRDGQTTSDDPTVKEIGKRATDISDELKKWPTKFNLQDKFKSPGNAKKRTGSKEDDLLNEAEKSLDNAEKQARKAIPIGD